MGTQLAEPNSQLIADYNGDNCSLSLQTERHLPVVNPHCALLLSHAAIVRLDIGLYRLQHIPCRPSESVSGLEFSLFEWCSVLPCHFEIIQFCHGRFSTFQPYALYLIVVWNFFGYGMQHSSGCLIASWAENSLKSSLIEYFIFFLHLPFFKQVNQDSFRNVLGPHTRKDETWGRKSKCRRQELGRRSKGRAFLGSSDPQAAVLILSCSHRIW